MTDEEKLLLSDIIQGIIKLGKTQNLPKSIEEQINTLLLAAVQLHKYGWAMDEYPVFHPSYYILEEISYKFGLNFSMLLGEEPISDNDIQNLTASNIFSGVSETFWRNLQEEYDERVKRLHDKLREI